jgi:hypothetical protein
MSEAVRPSVERLTGDLVLRAHEDHVDPRVISKVLRIERRLGHWRFWVIRAETNDADLGVMKDQLSLRIGAFAEAVAEAYQAVVAAR